VRGVLDTTTPAEVASWISDAKKNNQWMILNFHSIIENGEDAYHTSPANFDKMMQVVKDSGVQVMTYDKAINAFKSSPSDPNTVFGQ